MTIIAEDGEQVELVAAADCEANFVIIRLNRPATTLALEYRTAISVSVLLARKIKELSDYQQEELNRIEGEIKTGMKALWRAYWRFWLYACRRKFWRWRVT